MLTQNVYNSMFLSRGMPSRCKSLIKQSIKLEYEHLTINYNEKLIKYMHFPGQYISGRLQSLTSCILYRVKIMFVLIGIIT